MVHRPTEGVRLTHLPTGVTASCNAECRPSRRDKWGWCHLVVRNLLLARLYRPMPESAPIARSYDLCPPLGVEPNIRQNGVWLAVGMGDVQRVLGGNLDLLRKGNQL
jgi:hypothetical protein